MHLEPDNRIHGVRRRLSKVLYIDYLLVLIVSAALGAHVYWLWPPPEHRLDSCDCEPPGQGFGPEDRYLDLKPFPTIGRGFNNQFHEVLFYTYLASATGRQYVYRPFGSSKWTQERLNLSNVIDPTPSLAQHLVCAEKHRVMCPEEEVTNLTVAASGEGMIGRAITIINQHRETRCVRLNTWVLEWNFLSKEPAILLYWEQYSAVVLQQIRWTSEVAGAAQTFLERTSGGPYIALHLRRGDYTNHCGLLHQQRMKFAFWNQLPNLPDPLHIDFDTPTSKEHLQTRCLPTSESIISRLESILESSYKPRGVVPGLYVMHTGAESDVEALRDHFGRRFASYNDSNDRVKSSTRVLVDVEIGRRSDIFIGNGWSTVTSQVVQMRISDGVPYNQTRFW
ncbi:hypothetical protein P7C70_g8768, partial [Phenoliferia sp. Uapishka_3]